MSKIHTLTQTVQILPPHPRTQDLTPLNSHIATQTTKNLIDYLKPHLTSEYHHIETKPTPTSFTICRHKHRTHFHKTGTSINYFTIIIYVTNDTITITISCIKPQKIVDTQVYHKERSTPIAHPQAFQNLQKWVLNQLKEHDHQYQTRIIKP